MPVTRLTEVERAYFVRKSGGAAPTRTYNQIKRDYIAGFVGSLGKAEKMHQAETVWLQKVASDDGQTPGNYLSELWKQAASSVGETPTANMQENMVKFYISAP